MKYDLMKRRAAVVVALVGLVAFDTSRSFGQEEPSTRSGRPLVPAKSAPAAPQAFQPGMDDLMTMLVEPRHIKLYYAGTAKNWELAAFELGELRSAFRRIGGTIPVYRDRGVDETIGAIVAPRLDTTESAIAAGDPARFAKAYGDLTASCNECHTYLEHPFLVIKVPSTTQPASAYPNQSFETPAP